MGLDEESRHWRVRLRTATDHVLGAGTMLDSEHVLTCAHVVQDGDGQPVVAELVGLPGTPSRRAERMSEFWVPPLPDGRGDVAVVKLETRLSEAKGARLCRMPLKRGHKVWAFGFARDLGDGGWCSSELLGRGGPGGEWFQLTRVSGGPVGRGFSGAAVFDDTTHEVVGILVGAPLGDGVSSDTSWMIPLETLLGHLSGLGRWVSGEPAVDESFGRRVDSASSGVGSDLSFGRAVTEWLADEEPSVRLVITGDPDALSLPVALADRERPRATDSLLAGLPREVVPPPGSIDLAVDAAGKTARQVHDRIRGRIGTGDSMTLLVDAIDAAAEPDRLVTEVVVPLVERASALRLRLFLAFHRESAPELGAVRAAILDRLAARLDELAGLEAGNVEQQSHLAPRFADLPAAPVREPLLRVALRELRAAKLRGDDDWLIRHLNQCERGVARAVAEAGRVRAEFDRRLARRAELRARLTAYSHLAHDRGLDEDPEVADRHSRAWRELWEGPCDLAAAARAVAEYLDAIRRRGRS